MTHTLSLNHVRLAIVEIFSSISIYYSGLLHVMVTARESTSLSIMWQLLSTTSTVTTYTISYSNINNTECYNDNNTINDISNSMTMLILDNLEEATEYSIIVTATLSNSQSQQDSTSETTLPAGIN